MLRMHKLLGMAPELPGLGRAGQEGAQAALWCPCCPSAPAAGLLSAAAHTARVTLLACYLPAEPVL